MLQSIKLSEYDFVLRRLSCSCNFRREAHSSCSNSNRMTAARNSFAKRATIPNARQSRRNRISHLLPAASSVLDSIASLHLHLLSNGNIGISPIIVEHILRADRLGDRAINAVHLARLLAAILGSRVVAGDKSVLGHFDVGVVGRRRGYGARAVALLLAAET